MRYPLVVSSIAALVLTVTGCSGTHGGGSPVAPTATITNIAISGYSAAITGFAPQTFPLAATANMSSGAPQDVSALAVWASDAPAVASVAAGGVVTTTGNGLATITASYAGSVGRVTISVNSAAVGLPEMTGGLDVSAAAGPGYLYQAQLSLTFAETGGGAAFDVTGIQVDWFNFMWQRVSTTYLTPAEIASAFGGSNTVPAAGARTIVQTLDYTETRSEMNAQVKATVRDSSGNTSTLTKGFPSTWVGPVASLRAGSAGTGGVRR